MTIVGTKSATSSSAVQVLDYTLQLATPTFDQDIGAEPRSRQRPAVPRGASPGIQGKPRAKASNFRLNYFY